MGVQRSMTLEYAGAEHVLADSVDVAELALGHGGQKGVGLGSWSARSRSNPAPEAPDAGLFDLGEHLLAVAWLS